MTSEWEYVQKYCPETAERKYRENLQAKGPDLKIGNDMHWPPIWKRRSGRSTIPRRRH